MQSLAMEVTVDQQELKAAGAETLSGGRRGLRIHGWEVETRNRSILNSSSLEQLGPRISAYSAIMCLNHV